MRLSNDGTFDDLTTEDWQAYATSKPWNLASGNDGSRNVYIQFRDNGGNVSGQVTDSNFTLGSVTTPGILKFTDRVTLSGVTTTLDNAGVKTYNDAGGG